MTDRTCPACGGSMPGEDPRRRWCAPKCRQWVHRLGGPAAAARVLEGWAETWEMLESPDGRRNAAELRERAAALRAT
ncbi:MAG TPA: hypothetical protein VMM35_03745 [Longimicrobiales bacterium]|nr:hypothetical protein [Longimicrobiales bacterium]